MTSGVKQKQTLVMAGEDITKDKLKTYLILSLTLSANLMTAGVHEVLLRYSLVLKGQMAN